MSYITRLLILLELDVSVVRSPKILKVSLKHLVFLNQVNIKEHNGFGKLFMMNTVGLGTD